MLKKSIIGLQEILLGEEETLERTRRTLVGGCKHLPVCLDSLFKRSYFIPIKEAETEEGVFNSYCHTQYLIAPHSFRGCYILWGRGYYSEATIILRSILESLVQIKYLYSHKEKIKTVWTTNDISIWVMLKSIGVSRDFYERFYGRLMSGVSHRKIAAEIFRVERRSAMEGHVTMIPELNLEYAAYVINNFIAFIFGYLTFFKILFPEGYQLLEQDPSFCKQYKESIDWLNTNIQQHKKEFPRSLEWRKEIDKIIAVPSI